MAPRVTCTTVRLNTYAQRKSPLRTVWRNDVEPVFSVEDRAWVPATLPGALGVAFKLDLIAGRDAYSAELMRIEAGGSAPTHTDAQSHAFYPLEGSGEVTIGKRTWPLAPSSMCVIPSGAKHSLRSFGPGPLVMLVIYDPPRSRST